MLKLKYLKENKELAKFILNYWDYDQDDPDLFSQYRISSNAVYLYKYKGESYYLRFSPALEKTKTKVLAELELLKYLRNNGFPAVSIILSKNNNELEVVDSPYGTYYAVSFKKVSGVPIKQLDLTDDIIYKWGESLGHFHQLGSQYQPNQYKINDHNDIFNWMEEILSAFNNQTKTIKELTLLRNYFNQIPKTKENYGIIHYDFENDNVFYNPDLKKCNVIDFDDAFYHFYGMDIHNSLDSLTHNLSTDKKELATEVFINGYRSMYQLSDDMLTHLPMFRRFARLYGYVRDLRAISEVESNEPDWLVSLRVDIKNTLNIIYDTFGKPLSI